MDDTAIKGRRVNHDTLKSFKEYLGHTKGTCWEPISVTRLGNTFRLVRSSGEWFIVYVRSLSTNI